MNKLGKFKYVVYSVLAAGTARTAGIGTARAAVRRRVTTILRLTLRKAIGAGIGFGIAAGFAGIGQGLVGQGATEGVARNPGARRHRPDDHDHRSRADRVTRALCPAHRVRRRRPRWLRFLRSIRSAGEVHTGFAAFFQKPP